MRSKTDQVREDIKFNLLNAARPYEGDKWDQNIIDLKNNIHYSPSATAIRLLNEHLAGGQLPPLPHLILILKKFQGSRFGIERHVEEFFQRVKDKYQNGDSTKLNELYGEMMFTYIRRRYAHESDINSFNERWYQVTQPVNSGNPRPTLEPILMMVKNLYEERRCVYTFNVLCQAYASAHLFNEAMALIDGYPKESWDSWTYDCKFKLLKVLQGLEEAERFYRSILNDPSPEIKACVPAESYLNFLGTADKVPAVFDELPASIQSQEKIQRILMKHYLQKENFTQALMVFHNMSPAEPAYSILIHHLEEKGYIKLALEIYREARSKNYFNEHAIDFKPVRLRMGVTLDLHNRYTMGGGRPSYSGRDIGLLHIILLDFYLELQKHYLIHKKNFHINIITGIGMAHAMRDATDEFIQRHFRWIIDVQHGSLEVSLTKPVWIDLELLRTSKELDITESSTSSDQFSTSSTSQARSIVDFSAIYTREPAAANESAHQVVPLELESSTPLSQP